MECRKTIIGKKIWRDGNNALKTRPSTVEISLFRDGEEYDSIEIDTTDGEVFVFDCQLIYDKYKHKYDYKVDEVQVPTGYTKTIDGYNIINTINPGSLTISGKKTWNDNNNLGDTRPAVITIHLLQNGVNIQSIQVNKPTDNNVDTVDYSFGDKPQFDNEGNLYKYTVDESDVPKYEKSIIGYNITNKIINP